MTHHALRAVMALAYRMARRGGAPLWWLVLAVAWLVHRSLRSGTTTETVRLRRGETLEVRRTEPTP